ncbi:MAG: 2-hydroxyacid dehydrogenase [Acetobacteraceae bacterium]|nr:2-hydroxyacid dehydrogenase [Acetobacteraceae bacterium]
MSAKPILLHAFPIPAAQVARLAEHYAVHGPLERSAPEAIPAAARGAEALVTLGGLSTDAAMIAALPRLRLICCYGTGYEGVDRVAAKARGITVTHAGDSNSTAVAEFGMGLVIAATRRMVQGDRKIRAGGWTSLGLDRMEMTPGLSGGRLGIYGLGTIGRKLAARAEPFEMEIGYHNRSPRDDVPYRYFGSLMALAEWSDVLVVAARASAENRHAVNAAVLRALGPTGVLVNIGRGVMVDEAALCDALEARVIAGAGLDVYEDEPNVPDRLKALENVVITPHMAAVARTAQRAQREMLEATLAAFFAGQPVRFPAPVP